MGSCKIKVTGLCWRVQPDDALDPDVQRVQDTLDLLSEHFDSVQIFVTRFDTSAESDDGEEGTISVARGTGNWFSRFGVVRDWIVKSEEKMREDVRDE
jgi:hypothetical protein